VVDQQIFEPSSLSQLHQWFEQNNSDLVSVWVVIYKKAGGKQVVNLSNIVEEAICHGWIDSKVKTIDPERYAVYLTPRKAGSHWTEGNKRTAEKMIVDGRMTIRGMDVFAASR